MHKLPNPEDIISADGLTFYDMSEPFGERNWQEMLERVKEYGRQVRDFSLDYAADNAKVKWINTLNENMVKVIDKDSILNGKTSKDLEI